MGDDSVCAFDVIGIFGALKASGYARSIGPTTKDDIVLDFATAIPSDMGLKVVMADRPSGSSVCCDWCWKVNFFQSDQSAKAWMFMNDVTGYVIS